MAIRIDILLLSGYRGSGKDTFADFLVEKHRYAKASFAAVLKKMCSETFGIPLEWFEDRTLKETPVPFWPYMSPRDILIKVGTDSLRNHFDKNIWLNLAARNVAKFFAMTNSRKFVMTDARFLNELSFPEMVLREFSERKILPKDPEIWTTHARIERTKFTPEELHKLRTEGHDSDRQYLEMVPDIVIENTGTIEDLGKMVYAIENCPRHRVEKISREHYLEA